MSQPPEWSEPDPQQPMFGQPSPYGEPPPYPAGPAAGPPREAYAGFWIRFAGAFVDGLILTIVGAVLGGILPGAVSEALIGPFSGLALVLGAAYFTYLHSTKAGQTVGQRVCGIRLVNATGGGRVTPTAALLRWAISYLSGFILLLGYLWMLWDPHKQTWHDKVASTFVVKAAYYPPPAPFGQR